MSLSLAAVLLWLAVSIALVVTALVISRGGNGKGCTMHGLACAGQAPANAARPAKPSAAGRARRHARAAVRFRKATAKGSGIE